MFKRQKRVTVTDKGILALLEYEVYQAQQALQEPAEVKSAREWCKEAMKHIKMLLNQP